MDLSGLSARARTAAVSTAVAAMTLAGAAPAAASAPSIDDVLKEVGEIVPTGSAAATSVTQPDPMDLVRQLPLPVPTLPGLPTTR